MFAVAKVGWLGFDVGAAAVKAAQVVRADGGYRIRTASVVSRRQAWTAAALAAAPSSSADELRAAASLCEQASGSSAAALLPPLACDVLQLDAPTAKRGAGPGDLLRAAELELQRPLRDYLCDAWTAAGVTGKINLAATPRAWSDQLTADVSSSGWNCRMIDALPWALARAATLAEPARAERVFAVLDWGFTRASMCLVCGGAPALVRTLRDCAFQDVIDLVARGLRVDQRSAQTLLRRYGLPQGGAADSSSAGVLAELLAEPVARLVQEIQRTLGYWRGCTRGQSPQSVCLFGGGATLTGVERRLSGALGVPVEVWSLPMESRDEHAEAPAPCLLGAAIGLSALAWEAS
jgi:Tfp pilus assembly PilM family ATPase